MFEFECSNLKLQITALRTISLKHAGERHDMGQQPLATVSARDGKLLMGF